MEVERTVELKTGRLVENHEGVQHSKSVPPLWQKTDLFPAQICSLDRIKLRIYGLGNPSRVGSSDIILNMGVWRGLRKCVYT